MTSPTHRNVPLMVEELTLCDARYTEPRVTGNTLAIDIRQVSVGPGHPGNASGKTLDLARGTLLFRDVKWAHHTVVPYRDDVGQPDSFGSPSTIFDVGDGRDLSIPPDARVFVLEGGMMEDPPPRAVDSFIICCQVAELIAYKWDCRGSL